LNIESQFYVLNLIFKIKIKYKKMDDFDAIFSVGVEVIDTWADPHTMTANGVIESMSDIFSVGVQSEYIPDDRL
jgi:hypothetical protein